MLVKCVDCGANITHSIFYNTQVQRHTGGRWLNSAFKRCEECGEKESSVHRFKLHVLSERENFYKLMGGNHAS